MMKSSGTLLQAAIGVHHSGRLALRLWQGLARIHPSIHHCLHLQEDDMRVRWEAQHGGALQEVELLTRASGKMLLLHKLLPKLRAEGRQVWPSSAASQGPAPPALVAPTGCMGSAGCAALCPLGSNPGHTALHVVFKCLLLLLLLADPGADILTV
jgi:hypothetical protein